MADYAVEECEEAPPNPAATIETLGALGYSTESAIADLVDNSISAGARHVDVTMHWDGTDSWCAIADDGEGMSETQLRQAMTIGSQDPLIPRSTADLGRFGFGLKTASFSQCRELTVGSRTRVGRPLALRSWDLDFVRAQGRWLLLKIPPAGTEEVIASTLGIKRGTVVVWRRLTADLVDEGSDADDERAHRAFLRRVASVERHLAMTFGRFLLRETQPLTIAINRVSVRGWDPFLAGHAATQQLPVEPLTFRRKRVLVTPFVLPHRSKLTDGEYQEAGGPNGWNAQQGFYVYRSDRLIQAGDWFNRGQSKDDDHNLARIAIDVPPELDREWALDVKKASVRPPGPLVDDLRRIALVTRRRAADVYRHRGAILARPKVRSAAEPVWRQLRKHGELAFRINRKHPLIEELLDSAGPNRQAISDLIRVMEETIPVPLLPGAKQTEPKPAFSEDADDELVALAERIYERFLNNGLSREAARDRLLTIEPFNLYPEMVERMTRTD
ncbi:MAG: ATP-binding protein [Dehalococcoidia bacterium]|nr:MAG: ATP-binding protein [Dehalococcoidia bacterium]